MAIILKSERKMLSSRILYAGLYALLFIGGATMIYPFLLMFSGSLKSKVDQYDMNVVPRFLYDEDVLYRKFVEEKYNETIVSYQSATKDFAPNFLRVAIPSKANHQLQVDWEEFLESADMPNSFFNMGAVCDIEAMAAKMIPKNLRKFRQHIKNVCDGSIEVFRERFIPTLENWFWMQLKPERLGDRNYLVDFSNLNAELALFKATLPVSDRIYVCADGEFASYLKAKDRYSGSIDKVNAINGTSFGSFSGIVLADRVHESNLPGEWERFVRRDLHPQFIQLDSDALEYFADFLRQQYQTIDNLNTRYTSNYQDFTEVPLPAERILTSPQLMDFILFIQESDLLPVELIYLDTPDLRWRAYLVGKYGTDQAAAVVHGVEYSTAGAHLPVKELDYLHTVAYAGSLRWHFIVRNYQVVLDYIAIYGRGVMNTIIYCALAIISALIVNPLAAYALSRYQLPSQYKILLFMIATMAFPPMVTMIPNFLLLRELGLLNTFAALILPGVANGYSIFLMKGFFDSLPRELYDASEIDGASEWYKFWHIAVNLSKPIMAVIALGAFNAAYSNFMFAFVLCQDRQMWTMMVWLYQLQYFYSRGVVFASLLIAAIPTLLVFIFFQRIIIRGIVVPQEK